MLFVGPRLFVLRQSVYDTDQSLIERVLGNKMTPLYVL